METKLDLKDSETYPVKIDQTLIKAYKRRWVILTIYIIYAAMNSIQWVEYAIITNIVMKYYNVSSTAVDWTSLIYLAAYAPFVIPASYVIDRYGLRAAGLVGGLGTALGTFIKVFAINHDGFWVIIFGQFFLAASQVFIFSLAPRLSAVWFKATEVATACSLGIFGSQLGIAIGFWVTPTIVKNEDELDAIGEQLKIVHWTYAAIMIPVAVGLIFYFPKHPPKPPSVTQAVERQAKEKASFRSLYESIKAIMCNGAFIIHNVAYSINIAIFCAISTFLNQFILYYFPNAEEDAGRMGLIMIVVGMLGCILFGYYLDKTHKFKDTLLFIYFMSAVSLVIFIYTLQIKSKPLTYIAIASVGLFLNAYWPVAFEVAIELTFPSPEATTALLLVGPSQVVGALFGMVLGEVMAQTRPFWALVIQAALLGVGTGISAFIPNKLKRQEALAKQNSDEHVALTK